MRWRRPSQREWDINRELLAHLDLEADEHQDRGLSPEEARYAAQRAFGNPSLVKETLYQMNALNVLEAMARDVRHSFRDIQRNPRYAFMIVVTLAVCIGGNIAVFALVDSVLLNPLSTPDADNIVLMGNRYPGAGAGETAWSAAGDYYDRRQHVTALTDQAMFNVTYRILETTGASAERVVGMVATPSLFRLLRVNPLHGRAFEDAEGEIGSEHKVLLSYGLWQQLYAGNPNVIGRDVRLSGHPYTVVGIMPMNFRFYDDEVRFWIPLAFTPEQQQTHHSNNWFNIGRLKPGASVAQAQAQVNAVNAANLERAPDMRDLLINAGFETRVMRLQDYLVRDVTGSLYLLWAGSAVVLLIGALNAAGLVVARTAARTRETAVRLALGAAPARLRLQVFAENLVLSLSGGALGLILAWVFVRSLSAPGLNRFPRSGEIAMDETVVLVAVCVSIGAGVVIACLSGLRVPEMNISRSLTDLGRNVTFGRGFGSLRKGLVVAQVALTFVLLSGAVLLLMSFRELLRVQPGYDLDTVLTASTSLPAARFPKSDDLSRVVDAALSSLRALPGVSSAGATSSVPLSDVYNDSVIVAEGYVMKPGESVIAPIYISATPGYFESMGIRLLHGRAFDARDTAQSARVLVIDKVLAEKFWPGRDPVGRRMFQPSGPGSMQPDQNTEWLTVVGVVDSVRMKNLAGTGNEAGVYYRPFAQEPPRNFTFAIRTASDPHSLTTAVRSTVATVDPSLALFDIRTMRERASGSLTARKAALALSLGFGGVSLFLASIGLFGVLSYLVVQRRREVGVRVAVGCSPLGIFLLFLREGAVLVATGVVTGLVIALAGRSALERFLYGVRPLDPGTFALVAVVVSIVAFVAIAGPARHATRLNLSATLNHQ